MGQRTPPTRPQTALGRVGGRVPRCLEGFASLSLSKENRETGTHSAAASIVDQEDLLLRLRPPKSTDEDTVCLPIRFGQKTGHWTTLSAVFGPRYNPLPSTDSEGGVWLQQRRSTMYHRIPVTTPQMKAETTLAQSTWTDRIQVRFPATATEALRTSPGFRGERAP